jgi:outer membrane protein OmpA-like peptidoglycan-associated protein
MNNAHMPLARTMIAAAITATLFVGCATVEKKPPGSERVRAKLTTLQSDAQLASAAPIAMKEADAAVQDAERIEKDPMLTAHRVYIADHKVDTARALAEIQQAEAQRKVLGEQSEKARLDARTREADRARMDATVARTDAEAARQSAETSRMNAETARNDAMLARSDSAELQRQLAEMQAKPTDRGLVLTLGDTLFATGKSELKSGATANLDRLSAFLNEYPERTAAIEGFTDSMGSEEMNQALSQRRADSVKGYLVDRGVNTDRLRSSGRGENAPVADNDSAAGRQQNRRVEVVIAEAK